jgi:hypothetical protein
MWCKTKQRCELPAHLSARAERTSRVLVASGAKAPGTCKTREINDRRYAKAHTEFGLRHSKRGPAGTAGRASTLFRETSRFEVIARSGGALLANARANPRGKSRPFTPGRGAACNARNSFLPRSYLRELQAAPLQESSLTPKFWAGLDPFRPSCM